MREFEIGRLEVGDMHQAAMLLGREFGLLGLVDDWSESVGVRVGQVRDGGKSRAKRVFVVKKGGRIVGCAETCIYSWKRLGEQLLLKRDEENIWLSRMNKELIGVSLDSMAIELAYFTIDGNLRGRGLGSALFYRSLLDNLGEITRGNCVLFTIVMGRLAGSGMGQKIRQHLIEGEREVNGLDAGGKVVIKGMRFPLELVEEKFGVIEGDFMTRDSSYPTQVLAEKLGWTRLGLFKNLSPIYANKVFVTD